MTQGKEERVMHIKRRTSWLGRLWRLAYLRLIIPLKRTTHPPDYTARGIGIAVFWAFTPLIPFQTYLFGLTWLAARHFPRVEFNFLAGIAWIWITNAFTMLPVYFVFYLTGQILLGRWGELLGYSVFAEKLNIIIGHSDGIVGSLTDITQLILHEQGAALGVGCLPYAFGFGWIAYTWSLRFLNKSARHRHQRKLAAACSTETD